MIVIDGTIYLDAAISEQHAYNSTITQFPVESGAKVSDHVTNDPLQLSLQCYVSDTPIGKVVTKREPVDNAQVIYGKLLQLRDSRKLTTVQSKLSLYKNMVLQSLSVPVAAEHGLEFYLNFVEVVTVEVVTAIARVTLPRAKKKENLQNKPATFVPVDRRDTARQALDWVGETAGIDLGQRKRLTAADFDGSARKVAGKKVY